MMNRIIFPSLLLPLLSTNSFLFQVPKQQQQQQMIRIQRTTSSTTTTTTAFVSSSINIHSSSSGAEGEEWTEFDIPPGSIVDINRMEVVGSDYSHDCPMDSVVRCVTPGINFAGTLTQKAQVIASLGRPSSDSDGSRSSSSSSMSSSSDDNDEYYDYVLGENEYTVNRGTPIDKTRMYVLSFEQSSSCEGGTVLRTLKPGVMGSDGETTMHLAEVIASSGPDGDWRADKPVEIRDGMPSIDDGSARRSPGMVGFTSGTLGPPGGPGRQSGYTYGKKTHNKSSSLSLSSGTSTEDFRYSTYTPPTSSSSSVEQQQQQQQRNDFYGNTNSGMDDATTTSSSSQQPYYSQQQPSWTQDDSMKQQQQDFYDNQKKESPPPPPTTPSYPHDRADGTSISCNPVGEMWYEKQYSARDQQKEDSNNNNLSEKRKSNNNNNMSQPHGLQGIAPAESGIETLRETFHQFEEQVGSMLNEELSGIVYSDNNNNKSTNDSDEKKTETDSTTTTTTYNNSSNDDEVTKLKKEVERLESVIQGGNDDRAKEIQQFLAQRDDRISKLKGQLDQILQDYVRYEDQIQNLFQKKRKEETTTTTSNSSSNASSYLDRLSP